ncbi:GH1 family beta-glucosidase [Nocardioides humi]|uniref:GH1 family beta-glucosidase n=1 Tax=Nocardioides humi TaxID=449461 RepID=UPI0031CFC78F
MSADDLAARFPEGFRFGTVTSAPQVEGAVDLDGRGPSIWDTWAAEPGRIMDGSTPAQACDHVRRYAEDVALLRELGAPSYRFSVSWSRVRPTGRGAVSAAGLDFYDRLVDELLAAGIAPLTTLLHADLPQGLEDDGGWLNRDTVERFAEYAALVGARLGDRVAGWVPISEPAVMTLRGYGWGDHPPGRRLMFDSVGAVHHALLAHGRAAIALRAAGATSVGCANNHAPMWPASDDPADVGATKLFDALWNGAFLEPMLLGRYPRDLEALVEDVAEPGDLATIRQPLDFYGINYYSPLRVAATGPDDESLFRFVEVLGRPRTDNGWAIVPEALQEWLIMTRARYRAALPPFVITEAGAALAGTELADGTIDDSERIAYLTTHLEAVANAMAVGVDVRGFHVWSLLDCWEWNDGFLPRYGLVHVDHTSQDRRPKRSFGWYADLVAAHRERHRTTSG